MRRLSISPSDPEAAVVDEAAAIIRAGGVVAVPTDTLYGLAVDPYAPAAVARVFALKTRPADRAMPLVAAEIQQVTDQLGALSPAARRLAAAYWPGPLTLLVPRPAAFPAGVAGGGDLVGVRVPAHAVTRALCRACGRLLTATSANVSGQPATASPDRIEETLGAAIDLLLDAGPTPGGPPSTVVDVSAPAARLVRAGAISWDDIQACLAPL